MKRAPNTNESWLSIMTVVVFVMAAVGAAFALHALLPGLLSGPEVGKFLVRFGALLVASFFVVALVARLRRR